MKEIFLPDTDANKNLPKEETPKTEETTNLFEVAEETVQDTVEETNPDTLEMIEEAIEAGSESKKKSEDFIQQLADMGFQWLNMARERFDKVVDELVEKGKITTEDGSNLVGSLVEESEKIRHRFEQKTQEVRDMLSERLNINASFGKTKTSEIDLLKQRVEKLEAAVAALQNPTAGEIEAIVEV
ncbi:MAG: phasin family protein [Chitinophagales bacterium]